MMNLTGSGVEGNRQKLAGAEDTLNIYDFTVNTKLVRNAVSRYEADDQRTQYDMLKEIKIALKQWLSDWLDDRLISRLLIILLTVKYYMQALPVHNPALLQMIN